MIRAQAVLDGLTLEGDERLGVQIVRRALEEPLRIIAQNAGYEASVVVNNIRMQPEGMGFDAKSGKVVNMVEEGIIDPAKVSRTALQNASSIAGLLLTTEALICDVPEEKKESASHHGGGMPGMGGMGGMY
jgi:chaperonin GroEL